MENKIANRALMRKSNCFRDVLSDACERN